MGAKTGEGLPTLRAPIRKAVVPIKSTTAFTAIRKDTE